MIGVILPVDAGGMVDCKRIDGIIKIFSHVDLPHVDLPHVDIAGMGSEPRPCVFRTCESISGPDVYDF